MSDYVNVFGMPYMWGTEDFAYFSEADDKYISIFDTPFYSDIFRTFYELDTDRDGFISSIAQEMPFYENAFVRLQYQQCTQEFRDTTYLSKQATIL